MNTIIRNIIAAVAFALPIIVADHFAPSLSEVMVGVIIAHLCNQKYVTDWVNKYN